MKNYLLGVIIACLTITSVFAVGSGGVAIDPDTGIVKTNHSLFNNANQLLLLDNAGKIPLSLGAAGPTGPTGATGLGGPTGPTGAPGTNGTNGTNGAAGPTGPTGAAGTNGTNGANGAAGPTGPTGAAGTNGANGTNGAAGPTGPTGAVGANGTNGTNGAAGPTGPTGATGSNGTNGTNGSNGTNGATWRSGSGVPSNGTGVDGDYYFRTATSDVYLRASGTYSIVANIKGATGTAGTNGTNGTNGATGATGVTGPTGATGQSGLLGRAAFDDDGSGYGAGTVQNVVVAGNIASVSAINIALPFAFPAYAYQVTFTAAQPDKNYVVSAICDDFNGGASFAVLAGDTNAPTVNGFVFYIYSANNAQAMPANNIRVSVSR